MSPMAHGAATATMRAAVLAEPRRARLADAPLPEPGDGEVRIRLEGCGVCASNLPVWEGRPWFQYPLAPGAPGHEGWGTVDAIGSNVHGLAPGDRVAALTYHAFAEYDIAAAHAVVRLPESLAGVPLPGEPLGCAMNIFRRTEVQPGHTVAIIGIGFLGALLTQLASRAGARVVAISRRPFALEIARSCGAEVVLPIEDRDGITSRVCDLTGGLGCERVIEAVGEQGPLDLAGELTRERGRLIIAGYHQDGTRQVNMQLWNWRGLDVINAHERDPRVYVEGMRAAVTAVERGELDITALCTHRFPLDELDSAMRLAVQRPDGFLKALVIA
jgi:threonine dehydrogenase-like Zn-dependent dehydrogenase